MDPKGAAEVVDLDVEKDEQVGLGGFLHIRRMRLRTVRADGSRSPPFLSDFVERKKGLDAVVVGLWHRDTQPQVLLRKGLRPPLYFGRHPDLIPLPERRRYLFLTEAVAGIIEAADRGEEGIRRRAAEEAWEEAGFRIRPEDVELLGAPVFASPGLYPERFYLAAAQVDPAACHPHPPVGDGSPMEEGASQRFLPLEEALRLCGTGEIEDAKTELLLHRLKAKLYGT